MPIPVITTAVPAFQNPSAQAGLLPSAGAQAFRSGGSTATPRIEPGVAGQSTPPGAGAAGISQAERVDVIPPPEPRQQSRAVNDRQELPLQSQQALQAFERNAATENVIGSDAIDGINIFV